MSERPRFSKITPPQRQRPLLMQLALAAGALAQPQLLEGKNFTDEFWRDKGGKIARASMEQVVDGIKKYQLHPYARPLQRHSIVWSDGEVRLVWLAAKGKRKKPKASLLIIPSMINGAEIVDILPDKHSLMRWLAGQGFDVFLLEWGNLREDTELRTLDDALGNKLARAVTWLKSEIDTPLVGLGYCMGGVFLAAAEMLNPDAFDGLVFIATPWDFHAGAKGNFAEALTGWAELGLSRVQHIDSMPNEWLQMIFAGVEPATIARKFSAFSTMDDNSTEAKLFVSVEDWLNGGSDIPAAIIREVVKDWYQDNKVVQGAWTVQNKKIDARTIKKPSLVIIPAKDKIVPPASARALARQIKGADILIPDCGHISMMVAARAEKEVWEPLRDWICNQI